MDGIDYEIEWQEPDFGEVACAAFCWLFTIGLMIMTTYVMGHP